MSTESGLGGGLGALGAVIAPLGIAAMLLRQPAGPVGKLISAGAVSPETARRLESVDIPRPFVIEPAISRRIVIRTDDGRYWVDVRRNRRFRRRVALFTGLVVLGVGLLGWRLGAHLGPLVEGS